MATVAFVMGDQFEDSEFQEPYEKLREAGHDPIVVGEEAGKVLKGKKGAEVTVDRGIEDVSPGEFDAVVIPGGYSPDKIRTNRRIVDFTRAVHDSNKPVAAICHAGWMLAEAGILRDRTVTSWPSLKTDLLNAGANWVDQEVVEDGNLITSRNPEDLPAFTKTLLAQLEQRS